MTALATIEDGVFLENITDLVQRSALEYAQRMGPIRRAVRVAIEAGQLGEEQGGSALETIERLDALALHFHELVQMGRVKLPAEAA